MNLEHMFSMIKDIFKMMVLIHLLTFIKTYKNSSSQTKKCSHEKEKILTDRIEKILTDDQK